MATDTPNATPPSNDEPASARKISPSDSLLLRRGFPLRHLLHKGNERLEWAQAQKQLREMPSGSIVLLWGIRGTGKTQLAVDDASNQLNAHLAHYQSREGKAPRYATAGEIFRAIRGSYRTGAVESEKQVFDGFIGPDLLVIDEAHERAETDFENLVLTQIVDKRYAAMVDTIIIANLKKEELAKSLGTSIVSRVHECGADIECNWPSFRGKKP